MKNILLFLALSAVLAGITCNGQDLRTSRNASRYTYIYKLTDKQAYELYRKGINAVYESYFTQLVDSFLTERKYSKALPVAHYLYVNAFRNSLELSVESVNNLDIKILNNNRDLNLLIHDLQGNTLDSSIVVLNNKTIHFDNKYKVYRLPKTDRHGLLKITWQNHTSFYRINSDIKATKFKRVKNNVLFRTPIKYVAIPVNFVIHIPFDIYKSIRYRYYAGTISMIKKPFADIVQSISYGEPQGFVHKIWCKFNRYECPCNGYIAFNKPKYRPGDTVYFKAYITDYKSRPIKDSLKVVLFVNQNKDIGWVKPYRPGAYKFWFIANRNLGLQLDRTAGIYLKKGKHTIQSGTFYFEDYELAGTHYDLRSDKSTYHFADKIALYCRGFDENDLNLPDARVEFTLLAKNINEYYDNKVFVADTLWTYKQNLDPLGETKIMIPDSVFPEAAVSCMLEAHFLNSNNELKIKTINFLKDNIRKEIVFELNNDSLSIIFKRNGLPDTASAILNANLIYTNEKIELPCKLKINPFISGYTVKSNNISNSFSLDDSNSGIQCFSDRSADSVWFSIENPRNIPVTWTIFRKNRIIARETSKTCSFRCKSTTKSNYFASVQYVWGGKVNASEYSIPLNYKHLQIKLYEPQVIYPGQKTTITIAVNDAYGNPVPNADITAYSFTKKFPNPGTPTVPDLGKYYPSRIKYNAFKIQPKAANLEGSQKLNWKKWNPLMSLDTIELYKFLYPENGFYRSEFARTDSTFAEVSPFLVDSIGNPMPVNIIYIDSRPVYFSLTTNETLYSFRATQGWHRITIRTTWFEVTIPRIFLKNGTKSVISVNPYKINKEYSVVKQQPWYSRSELALINKSIFAVQNSSIREFSFLQQGEKVEMLRPTIPWSRNILVGPYNQTGFTFQQPEHYSIFTEFEPGFEYEFNPGLVKMRSWNLITVPFNKKSYLDYKLPPENFNDSVYTYNDVMQYWDNLLKMKQIIEPVYINPWYTDPGNGRLRIEYAYDLRKPNLQLKNVLVYSKKDTDFVRIYPGNERLFHQLEPGEYKLLLILYNNEYIKYDSVKILRDGINFYRIKDDFPFHADRFVDSINAFIREQIYDYNQVKYYDPTEAERKRLKALANHAKTITYGSSSFISGQIFDATTNEPLAGANIFAEGTTMGACTDMDGFFQLSVPDKEQYKLSISFIGYMTEKIDAKIGANIKIYLTPDIQKLEEVVVIGYGVQRKVDITGSVATVSSALSGRVAGIAIKNNASSDLQVQIRGVSSLSKKEHILYIIDGIPVTDPGFDFNSIDPSTIGNIEILKNETAQSIYGAKASDGAVIISTKKGKAENIVKNMLQNKAFMEGVAQSKSLRNNFSDYAYWKPDLTTNEKGLASFDVTFPDDITSWRTFALVMGPKKTSGQAESEIKSFKPVMTNLAIPRFLIKGDQANFIGKSLNYTPDSISIKTKFEVNDLPLQSKSGKVLTSQIDTLTYTATNLTDSLKVKYALTMDNGYSDGELRYIPVYPAGTIETKGTFYNLDKDTTLNLTFDKTLGKVTLHAEADIITVMLEELRHMRNYGYYCNEQLASKLKGMIGEQKLYKYLDKNYPYEYLINKTIRQLEERRNQDSLWGWWKEGQTEWWITLHAAEALLMARKLGYKVNVNFNLIPPHLYSLFYKMDYRNQIRMVKLLKSIDTVPDYKSLVDNIHVYDKDTVGRYELMELKQIVGLPYDIKILLKEQKSTIFGNIYWGRECYSMFDDATSATLVAYRILRNDSTHAIMLNRIRNYFLERKNDMHWRNTWESCCILETILPDLIKTNQLNAVPKLQFTGDFNETVSKYPFTHEVKPGDSITLTKTTNAPVYFTAYQQFFNTNPVAVNKDFRVYSWFEKTDSVLTAGKPVDLKVEVLVKKASEYVMIEIPIPAGCSYQEKKTWSWNESHREYEKDKVTIFCSRLAPGTYTFDVNLLPRYNGVYHLNPAKAELMYFPVFYGREREKSVIIK